MPLIKKATIQKKKKKHKKNANLKRKHAVKGLWRHTIVGHLFVLHRSNVQVTGNSLPEIQSKATLHPLWSWVSKSIDVSLSLPSGSTSCALFCYVSLSFALLLACHKNSSLPHFRQSRGPSFFFFFGHATHLVGSQFPDQGLNPVLCSDTLDH